MIKIFGPDTSRLVRLLEAVDDLSSEDVEAVADAWEHIESQARTTAWARIQRSATPLERITILNAALLARQHALTARPPVTGGRKIAFRSAVWDAGAAVVAQGQDGMGQAYGLLVSALATRVPWLTEGTAATTNIPSQRVGGGTRDWDEPLGSPARGRG